MTKNVIVNRVVLIILDDVRSEHLFNLIEQGKLPNMAHLAESGIKSNNCITSFPSVTLPCYANIITGSNSGYYPKEGSGVPSYHWINRTDPPSESKKPPFIRNYSVRRDVFKINKDIGLNVKTIFEQANEGNFLSIISFLFRGSTFTTPTEYKPELIFKKLIDILKNPKESFINNEQPKITIVYIPHTDDLMHEKGFDHPEYINLIIDCDKYIGLVIETLKQTGYYDDTAICITSDHGNYKAQNLYNLEPFFQSKGLIPYNQKTGKGDFDSNFGGIGFFNFKGNTWQHHPTIKQMKNFKPSGITSNSLNLFETLWEIPGVKFMFYRDDKNTPDRGIIHLEYRNNKKNKRLTGRIEYDGHGKKQKTKYIYDSEDLFGYINSDKSRTLLDNKPHSMEEWLAATYKTDFIYIIDQLPRFFKNPRSCDIMVSTRGEYCFNYAHGKTSGVTPYSHDLALKKSMTVPLIIGGSSNIPKLDISYCKTIDIVPTLLNFLGIKPDKSVLGKSLIN
jgi:hypothetical protein